MESAVFDVWPGHLLPLLSLRDIIQLCGTSKHLRALLFDEYMFSILCRQRYQLRPRLDVSYIDAAINLEIVTGVASVHHSHCIDTMRCIYGSNVDVALVGREKKQSIITLSCLELMLPAQLSDTTSWDSAGLFRSLAESHLLHAVEDREFLPNLLLKDVDRKLEEMEEEALDDFNFEPLQYLFRDVTDLFMRDGSEETCQEVIINSMEALIARLNKYMPYVNRSRRLVEIAHSLHDLAQTDATLLSALGLEDLNAIPLPDDDDDDDDDEWTDSYNPYYHCDINYCDNYNLGEEMDKSRSLIDMAAKLSEKHSVLRLLIMGRLKTLNPENYFMALNEYEQFWNSLSESSRPSRKVLCSGLGSHLLSSISGLPDQKLWTKLELVDAMKNYGKELVFLAQEELPLSEKQRRPECGQDDEKKEDEERP
ncbi:uncharacterized protein LOC135806826 [Sycon ciliatum]|uniref:uncharacterized protein LOC135806826 n=1 Tax=Sycon ciliatum TaxID=27933 RepID=UPI0031F667E6